MNIKQEIGSRIRDARNKLNLSLSELSKITGLIKSTISNWENGRRTPSLDDAKILSDALKVPAIHLLCMDINNTSLNSTQSFDHFNKIPFYNIETLQSCTSTISDTWLPIPHQLEQHLSKDIFAFSLNDNSMSKIFKKNDIVVLERNAQAIHGDFVLINIKATNRIFFRKLNIDDSTMETQKIKFCALNKDWPDITSNSPNQYTILGVLKNNLTIFF